MPSQEECVLTSSFLSAISCLTANYKCEGSSQLKVEIMNVIKWRILGCNGATVVGGSGTSRWRQELMTR